MLLENKKTAKNSSLFFLFVMLFFSFILLNAAAALLFGAYKFDVSGLSQYSLYPKSRNLLKELDMPLNVRVFISKDLEEYYPEEAQYSRFLIRFLEQYKRYYEPGLKIEIVSVSPFTPEEQDATNNKIRPLPGREGRSRYYFGAVFSNEEGMRRIIPYFNPARQNYLEQDISRILASYKPGSAKKIGIVSPTLPVIDTAVYTQKTPDWAFIRVLKNDYEIEKISENEYEIVDYDAVIVINPQNISKNLAYGLDQYLMNDGRLLVFMDPFAEMDIYANSITSPDKSDFSPFLSHWGLQYQDNVIVGDKNLAEPALMDAADMGLSEDFPFWMQLQKPQMNASHPLTKNLQNLSMKTAGIIELSTPFDKNAITVLLTTTKEGGVSRSDFIKYHPRKVSKQLFRSDNLQYNLAILSEGRFLSNYTQPITNDIQMWEKMQPFRPISGNNSKLLVVTDSDMLATANWSENFINIQDSVYDLLPQNNNIDFLLAAVDYLTGNQHFPVIGRGFSSLTSISLEKILNKKYRAEKSKEIFRWNNRILADKKELEKIEHKIKISTRKDSENLRKQEQLIRSLEENETQLKRVNYEIDNLIKQLKERFILLNTLIFPLIIILLVKIAVILYGHWVKKQSGRILDGK